MLTETEKIEKLCQVRTILTLVQDHISGTRLLSTTKILQELQEGMDEVTSLILDVKHQGSYNSGNHLPL